MSRSVNKVMLLGNCGSDPEVRSTASGSRVAKFSLATNRSWRDKSGQTQEKTDWHRCSAWGKLAEIIEQYVHKGDKIYVEGRIEYSQTESDDGGTRYWTDIQVQELVMLGSKDGASSGDPDYSRPSGSAAPPKQDVPLSQPLDDLPFAPMRLLEPWR